MKTRSFLSIAILLISSVAWSADPPSVKLPAMVSGEPGDFISVNGE